MKLGYCEEESRAEKEEATRISRGAKIGGRRRKIRKTAEEAESSWIDVRVGCIVLVIAIAIAIVIVIDVARLA